MAANVGNRGAGFSVARVGLVAVVLVAVAAVVYAVATSKLPEPSSERARAAVGMGQPVALQLAERFADADDDLLADPPESPDDLIDPDPLTFCYIPSDDEPAEDADAWRAFTDHLARATGRPVEYLPIVAENKRQATSLQLRALREGRLHVAGFNTGAVPQAVNTAGFVPVASPANAQGGDTYRMALIVPANSPIHRIDDLDGHTLALTEPSSNSGYKAPLVLLLNEHGLALERDFSTVLTFSHEASILGVANRDYHIAAVASDLIDPVLQAHGVDRAAVRVVDQSPPFPRATIGYAHNLQHELADNIRKAVLGFQAGGDAMVDAFGSDGVDRFAPVSYKDDFALVRQIDSAFGARYENLAPNPNSNPNPRP